MGGVEGDDEGDGAEREHGARGGGGERRARGDAENARGFRVEAGAATQRAAERFGEEVKGREAKRSDDDGTRSTSTSTPREGGEGKNDDDLTGDEM